MAQTIKYTTIGGEEKEFHPPERAGRRGGLSFLKKHVCTVTLPDKRRAQCHYERRGKEDASFDYYLIDDTGRVAKLWTKYEAINVLHIEAEAQRLTQRAFEEAIAAEQKWELKRATIPNGKTVDSAQFTLSLKAAKYWGGRYAFCYRLGDKYIPEGVIAFKEAATAVGLWEKFPELHGLVLCGCCRYRRRWQRLHFDPLRAMEGYDEEASCRSTTLTAGSENAEAVSNEAATTTGTEDSPKECAASNSTTSPATTSGSRSATRRVPVTST